MRAPYESSWLATASGPVSHRPSAGSITVNQLRASLSRDVLNDIGDELGIVVGPRPITLAELDRYREETADARIRKYDIFEGDFPPYAVHGTHIAARCTSCPWAVWTFRATDAGMRELQRRRDIHVQQTHEAITQVIPVVDHAPVAV
ncbi:hypothetical protein HH308_06230 [Gordonia sp. TBRC 11910]|uniref:Uncharacterized protein n=1 Tax=Gordonia asplenii TaxID=2725283 RepID=A0A848KRT7_9ACTN|nr:hypothetical protein [Gordonia asplenii]NMO00809.1 hypothetical protein [Gordonia asplenii]